MIYLTIGQKIKATRKNAGLTQKELAQKMGLSFQSIAQWENDLRKPKIETLKKIADALECPIDTFTADDLSEEIPSPELISKKIHDITEELESEHGKAVNAELMLDVELFKKAFTKNKSNKGKNESDSIKNLSMSDEERNKVVYEKIIKLKEKEMNKAVKELDFETAAILRDEILVLKTRLDK